MENMFKLAIFKSILLSIELFMSLFGKFAWVVFMPSYDEKIIKKVNFLSPINWGYGNIFPIVFVFLTIANIVLTIVLIKKRDWQKFRINIKLIGILGIVCLLMPFIIFGKGVVNIGASIMLAIQCLIVVVDYRLNKMS